MDSPFTTGNQATQEVGPFQIVMDNLNLQQKTRHKTLDNANKVHNLVHSIAIQHRVTADLDSVHPQADILSIPNDAFIPDQKDHDDLNADFKVLIQRAVVNFIPAFKDFKNLVTFHIQHEYSKMSQKKSAVVPLGILEKDENITEQMIDIVQHLQQYVARRKDGKLIPILLGGDALSVERGEGANRARLDAINQLDRLEGFVWKSEDWHGHVISLQDTFNLLYKGTSSGDKGTLFQLRNMFDRRGVKSEVTSAVNEDREFLRFVTQGFIILAAYEILNITNHDQLIAKLANMETQEQKQVFLDKLADEIITAYVAIKPFRFSQEGQTQENSRFPCGYPGCPKTFAADGRPRQKHRQSCLYKNLNLLQEPEDNFCKEKKPEANSSLKSEEDYKRNYSCCLLREGLMDWCREDAAKENDGDRLIRMWRFDMLRFAISNHTKYKLLAFKLQAQLMALLPPKLAYELKHNRTVNIHGGEGGNVPCDLALEFMNMRAKDALNGLHGNLTSKFIQRCGRSLQGCNSIVDSYMQGLEQYFGKPSNSKPSLQKDIDMLVEKLTSEKLFARIPGRSHRSFPTIEFDTMKKMNGEKLYIWLSEKKEEYARIQRSRSYFA